MDEAFIVMQIGNDELDRVCDEVLVPAVESAGLVARRVDRDNEGGLLKVEIVEFLERAVIIVADLTNERPNCYLEVGYAMGLGKKRNLILTAREDHHHRSPNYRLEGPRVHFDLEGYDLLLWDPNDLEKFRSDLGARIKRRLAILEPAAPGEPDKASQLAVPVVDVEWLGAQREVARKGLSVANRDAYMEAAVAIAPKGTWRQAALMSAVEASQIKTFGWPIAIVLNRDPFRPHPTAEGVRAEVSFADEAGSGGRGSYDFWSLRRSGDFYLLQSLFEDERRENEVFFDTRIIRVTELLLFLSRCYSRLDAPDSTALRIELRHGGLAGRELTAAGNRQMPYHRTTSEAEVGAAVECTLAELQTRLVELVRELLEPFFMVFDFLELGDQVWAEIVNGFVEGRIP